MDGRSGSRHRARNSNQLLVGLVQLPLDHMQIARAAEVLHTGGLVAFPTETVYGLGALAEDEIAVQRIFATKQRPAHLPVIVHLADTSIARRYTDTWNEDAQQLAAAYWPGPLTLVVPRLAQAATAAAAHLPTIGLRVPNHPWAHALLEEVGTGIAAPSANRFGAVSPTTAQHVWEDLGDDVEYILDGGPCEAGIESTIVECIDTPRVLRLGAITVDQVGEVVGADRVVVGGATTVSGNQERHYSPRARVMVIEDTHHLAQLAAGPDVAVIGPAGKVRGVPNVTFGASNVHEYAHGLYAALRDADHQGKHLIVAVSPEGSGLAAAIRDRLQRAAAQ